MNGEEKIIARVGSISVALPASRVQTIVSKNDATDLFNKGELTMMTAVLGGLALPLFDVRKAVGLPERKLAQTKEILVIGDGRSAKLGLIVDSVIGTVVCDGAMHAPAEAVKLPSYPLISYACAYQGKVVLMLDIDAILASYGAGMTIAQMYQQGAV